MIEELANSTLQLSACGNAKSNLRQDTLPSTS